MHHDRDAIAARYREADTFSIVLGPADTAYDPETGDSLLGPATIRYGRGEFPGPPRTATVEPAPLPPRLSTCGRCGGTIERRPGAVAGWGHLTETSRNADGHLPDPDDSYVSPGDRDDEDEE